MLDISPVKSPEGGQRQTPGRDLGGEPPAAAELPPQGDKPQARLVPAPAHGPVSRGLPSVMATSGPW